MKFVAGVFLLCCVLPLTQCRSGDQPTTSQLLAEADGQGLDWYEATRIRGLAPTRSCQDFKSKTGIQVITRDSDGQAQSVRLTVLSDNPGNKIYVIGDFNQWGDSADESHRLLPASEGYFSNTIDGLKHGDQYRFLVNGKQLLDPSAALFTTKEFLQAQGLPAAPAFLNSVFWDFDRPGAFHPSLASVDLREQPLIIAESEVYALAEKWPVAEQVGPKTMFSTYAFIATSGIISELKGMGYNAIEFLPFNASVDGDHWHYRYQVFGLFAPESRYGTPDDFARMVEAFNQAGIAVIMDAVVGHYPYEANAGARSLAPIGQHNWKKADGGTLYGAHPSPWNTNRYDYANPYIRRFLTDSVMNMMCRFSISGIRFDNLDGIKDYAGPGGGGPDFLRLLVDELRAYRPESLLIGEMFFGNNNVMRRKDQGGYGINFRTHSDYFDFLMHNMKKPTESVDIERLRNAIRNPWIWKEAARVQYVTNHDEAANGRGDTATGKYVATLLGGGSWYYAEKKTLAFGSITMLSGSAYLDMPQMRLLQEGSFNKNSFVQWSLRKKTSQRQVFNYFTKLSHYIKNNQAFAFHNFHPNIENHVDNAAGHKIISVFRRDKATGKTIFAITNLGHQGFADYRFGVHKNGTYKIVLNSDHKNFGGSGKLEASGVTTIQASDQGMHGKSHSLGIPWLGPYSTVVVEQ